MCELPLMPASGKSTRSRLPPAALKASAYVTLFCRMFFQRGCSLGVVANYHQDRRAFHRGDLAFVAAERWLDRDQSLHLVRPSFQHLVTEAPGLAVHQHDARADLVDQF